ncbi:MAG: aldose 1-epimerase family protein [Armatimonadaceae bacterium]
MAQLWGRTWTRRELLERVGDLAQVAGVERFTLDEGVAGGVRAARVRSGAGLDYTVLFSRGMDIGQASYKGIPLAWVSATGVGHPHAFEPETRGWLRTFHGGLLTGCGLSNAGAHNTDGDEALGLHGYLSHIPAEDTAVWTQWKGDDAEFVAEGVMREARVFSENLRLMRRVVTPLGVNTILIQDTVENVGFKTVPLMLLYHLNFGFPVVDEGTKIRFDAASPTTPRDAVAEKGMATWQTLDSPIPGYEEQCFFHDPQTDDTGFASVTLHNPALDFDVIIRYDKAAFPYLTQWKMMGQGEYVCGIEPANCRVLGRATERTEGRLQQIEPGEVRIFRAEIAIQ